MSMRANWKLIGLLTAGTVVVGGAAAYWLTTRSAPPHYVTTAATQGDVVTTITASGSVNPVVVVEVGTYVSGTIETLSCDYNTRVHKGQLCAKIDPKPYQVVVDQDQAELDVAKAQLVKDQANVVYTKVSHERYDLLFAEDSTSHDAADAALNAYNQAVALVGLDVATVAQKTAALKAAQVNLDYTNIVSPVDGTVVSRNVTMGQTVAASFQTPTLFLIATDLTKMQVDTNVSESDIGEVKEGNKASFTVDAFPKRTFDGAVNQVRQSPQTVQNVVTYDVVVGIDNTDLALKPGMTAATRIVTEQHTDVIRVPSQGLRYSPGGSAAANVQGQAQVWVLRDGQPVAVPVTAGLDDDTFTEIIKGELKPDDLIITAEQRGAGAAQLPRPRF